MRSLLLASAALLGVAAGTAYAQTSTTGAGGPAAAAGSQAVMPDAQAPGTVGTDVPAEPSAAPAPSAQTIEPAPAPAGPPPRPARAANRSGSSQGEILAPLPAADLRPDGTAMDYLHSARDALNHHRRGEAEEALERAETRMLDRSVTSSSAGQPDSTAAIQQIGDARRALGRGDTAQAEQIISQVISTGPTGTTSSGAAVGGGGMSGSAVPSTGSAGGIGANQDVRYDPSVGSRSDMGGPATGTPTDGAPMGATNDRYQPEVGPYQPPGTTGP